ncbi:MAG: Pyrimidine-nucleoside phosphorylase [Verrucomicrobiae bacterium]|nr:Pyrimidine-nucleoside phosphorylase [Verrucomicrobiae bacterium]
MLPAQVIQKKRDGHRLTEAEIRFFIEGFTRGDLPDYQMAALAMAVCFQGMNFDETMWLTRAMVESGKVVDWKPGNFLADKHSTGGIGDKTSLLIAPLVACCGIRVPMISGRGLGPTGGTLDKLEAIPGFRTGLSLTEFQRITDTVGCCLIGATPEIAPADRKLYALRDVTATVSCLPLIVASIMSKKLAENVDGLVLDVKWGTGAFMRTRQASLELARAMVEVGKRYGKKVVALQTDMNQPLGEKIGNALEIQECLDILAGKSRPKDLLDVSLALAAEMLQFAGKPNDLEKLITSGAALEKFHEMIHAQGGNASKLPVAKHQRPIPAPKSGYIHGISCDQIGYAVIALGGGRKVASDKIDFAVGFEHPKKIGDRVECGEPLLLMHYNSDPTDAERMVQAAYDIQDQPVTHKPQLITERIA